jgi:hypothetical protein
MPRGTRQAERSQGDRDGASRLHDSPRGSGRSRATQAVAARYAAGSVSSRTIQPSRPGRAAG